LGTDDRLTAQTVIESTQFADFEASASDAAKMPFCRPFCPIKRWLARV